LGVGIEAAGEGADGVFGAVEEAEVLAEEGGERVAADFGGEDLRVERCISFVFAGILRAGKKTKVLRDVENPGATRREERSCEEETCLGNHVGGPAQYAVHDEQANGHDKEHEGNKISSFLHVIRPEYIHNLA